MQTSLTCMAFMGSKTMRLSWERHSPLTVGSLTFCAAIYFGEPFFDASVAHKWHMDALYASVFNIAAAASAFLFAFYTYARTADGRILTEIRRSDVFKRACRYMIWAIALSGLLAIVSVPFVVTVPEPRDIADRWYWIVAIWFGFSAYVFAAIIRSAYHFIAIMEAAFGERLQG